VKPEPKPTRWGSDSPVSMPQALDTTETAIAHMEGFCFTPDGIRLDISSAEREGVLMQGYGPQGAPDAAG